jgi:ABC-type transport system substrate-binding protein
VRNDRDYGGKTKVRKIAYSFYTDTCTPYQGFKAGNGDVAYPAPADIQDAKALPGFHQTPQGAVDYLQPNWMKPPFDNLDARIAFDAAIDRVTLAQTI